MSGAAGLAAFAAARETELSCRIVDARGGAVSEFDARIRLDEAGSYRLFADFPRGGEAHTLAADLPVDGEADLRDLPAPSAHARTGSGYDVEVDEHGDGTDLAVEFPTAGRYRLFLQFKHEGRVHTAAFTREVK